MASPYFIKNTLFPAEKNWGTLTLSSAAPVTITTGVVVNNGVLTLSAGTQSYSSGLVVFSNSNNLSFGASAGTITASFSQTLQPFVVGANGGTSAVNTLIFSNSNGISFGIVGSTLTASVGSQAAGTISAGTASVALGEVVFSNSNGITFGLSGSTVTASYTVPGAGAISISAGTTSNNLNSIVFSNSNGISFGLNGSTVTGSYTVPTVTNSSFTASAGTRSETISRLVFSNSNGISFGLTGGTVTATVATNYLTTAMASNRGSDFVQALAVFAGTNASGTIASDGISVSVNAQSTVPQNVSLYALGNTTQNSSTALSVSALSINAIGSLTVGYSNGSIQFSAPDALTSQSNQALSGSNGSFTFQTASFGNLNGFSFYTSNGSIVGSYTAGAAGGVAVANSQTTFTASTVNLIEGGGAITIASTTGQSLRFSVPATSSLSATGAVSISVNGSTISIGAPVQTNQTLGLYASSNTTLTSSGTVDARSFTARGIGIVSVGVSASELIISATQSNQAFSAGAAASTFQTLSFQDSNGISFSNNGGAIRLTHDLQYTSATSAITSNALNTSVSRVINIVAATNSTGGGIASLSSNVSFSNANNFTFYTSAGGAVVASFNNTALVGSGFTSGGNNIGLSGTLNSAGLSLSATVAAQTNQTLGIYASSNTTLTSSGTIDARSLTFRGIGIASVGYSANEVLISVPAGAGQTGISSIAFSDTTYTSGQLSFRDGNGISWASTTGQAISITHGLQYTSATSAITSNALNTSASRVINIVAATDSTGGGTASLSSNVSFSAANGLTFYTSAGGAIVGSVVTSYRASNDAVGLNTALTANGVAWTVNSSGISLNVPAFLTTAALSSQTLAFSLSGNTATTNSSQILNGGYALAGGNGVTLQQSNNTVSISVATNYQSQGAYLTTAALSQDSSKYAGTGVTTAGGAGFSATLNTSGLSVSIPAWLTTADLSANSSNYFRNWKLTGNTAGTTSSAQGTDLWFSGGNSITVSGNSNSIVFSVGNYITTARASTDAVGLNTAQSNATWTVNSSGLSLDARGYAGTGTTFNGANISGSITQNSLGVQLSMSVAAPGAAAENNNHNLLGVNTAGNTTASGSTIGLSGINLTLSGTNNSIINISAPATSSISGTGQVSISVNASTISIGVPLDVTFSNWGNVDEWADMVTGASGITQTSGSSIFVQPFTLPVNVSASFVRLLASYNDSAIGTAGTTSANTSFSVGRFTTFALVLYTQGVGASSRSLQSISSTSVGLTGKTFYTAGAQGSQYTVTVQKTFPQLGFSTNSYTSSYAVSSASIVVSSNSNTLFTGPRFLDIPWGSSLPPGNYWFGLGASTSSASNSSNISFAGTNGMPMTIAGVSQSNVSVGLLGAATSASDHQMQPGLGVWTTNASGVSTGSMGLNSISQVASNPVMPFQFIRQA